MRISDIFGADTFNIKIMRSRLPHDIYKKFMETFNNDRPLDDAMAEAIAHAVKEWALEEGVTHFAHWFHPLGRGAALKHDSFLASESLHSDNLGVIERFEKHQLIQAEPDASSFPSGGMRSTFEARGYTAWDSSSPIFLMRSGKSATVYIPSVFISYNGDALDMKTPLLRSMKAVEEETKKLLKILDSPVNKITPMIGAEQEFFLIRREDYLSRPDLLTCGRTLFGQESPRGQKLADHYFKSLPSDVLAYFNELESVLYRLGIPLATKHSEVAPRQYEIALIYEDTNLGTDHNRLLMEVMVQKARELGLEVLFHEKPFKGVNGSGKHCNWSLQKDEENNLYAPGNTYNEQLHFLLFLMIMVKAVYRRSGLLRAAIANNGNDIRLGGNEAPPSIISIFLGTTITNILKQISEGNYKDLSTVDNSMKINLNQLPDLLIGNTDRNRTSPLAFTGNKFEFRAVGSSQSLAMPNIILNLIVAESVSDTIKMLSNSLSDGIPITEAVLQLIKNYYIAYHSIIFNGNNYSENWVEEAKKRGLPNLKTSYDALQMLVKEENISLFETYKILTKREIKARYNVEVQQLETSILIEANTFLYVVNKEIIPATLKYSKLLTNTTKVGGSFIDFEEEYSQKISALLEKIRDFEKLVSKVESTENSAEKAKLAVKKVKPDLESIRELVDYFEGRLPQELWPFPTYIDMLDKN